MQISDMRKFLVKFIIFALCLFVVDYGCGVFFPLLQSNVKGGVTYEEFYLSNYCKADILILGSSRAHRHYVPLIIDSLGGFSYNAGEEAMGIILGFSRYRLCAENLPPKIVIYDVSFFDYIKEDNSKNLKYMRAYGNKKCIRDIIYQIEEPYLRIKMISNMYRYSSKLLYNIWDFFMHNESSNRGYMPLFGECLGCDEPIVPRKIELDSVKLKLFDEFVKDAKANGSKLYFVISPIFSQNEIKKIPADYAYAEVLADKYKIPLLKKYYIPGISDNRAFFTDPIHLNDAGAKAFSRNLVKDLLLAPKGGFAK